MSKIRVFQFPIRSTNGGISHYAMQNWKYIDKTKFCFDFGAIKNRVPMEAEIVESGAGMKYISCYAEENEEKLKILSTNSTDLMGLFIHSLFFCCRLAHSTEDISSSAHIITINLFLFSLVHGRMC